MDSVVTVDLLLSEAGGGEFSGGEFQTFERDGKLLPHELGRGDAVSFLSHKYHSVGAVTQGVRKVLVIEFWRGTARTCPHRCESLRLRCKREVGGADGGEDEGMEEGEERAGGGLPFRLGAVEGVEGGGGGERVVWQSNATDDEEGKRGKIEPEELLDEKDEAWDLFG